jgi:hypothetical protein
VTTATAGRNGSGGRLPGELPAPAAGALGRIHGSVSLGESLRQPLRRRADSCADRRADGYGSGSGHRDRDSQCRRQAIEFPAGDGAAAHDHELISAEPTACPPTGAIGPGTNPSGNGREHMVTCGVPAGIIDLLEPVEVN